MDEQSTHPAPMRRLTLRRGRTLSVVQARELHRFDYEPIASTYRPRDVAKSEWHGDVGEFARDHIARIEGLSPDEYRRFTRVLARIASAARRHGHTLDIETVLAPRTVETFTTTVDGTESTKATMRSDLRRLGLLLTEDAPWQADPEAYRRTTRTVPYSVDELRILIADASLQPSARALQASEGMLALCLGAGARPGELMHITSECVIDLPDGRKAISFPAPHERVVPVQPGFQGLIADLASRANEGRICGGRSASKNYPSGMSKMVRIRGSLTMSAGRLRSTWIVAMIAADTPIVTLLDQAGLSTPGALDDYYAYAVGRWS